MKITAIKAQVKNPQRVSLFIDGAYAFSLNHTQLLEQKIRVGLELDQTQVTGLKEVSDLGKAYERALGYVMIRPRSEWELRQYARRKQWPAEQTEVILTKLQKKGYINDAQFAKAWVESRALTKATSAKKVRLELKQKGVADTIISEVMSKGLHDETAALHKIITKKRKSMRYQDDQKLKAYLIRQGFRYDVIDQAFN